MWSPFLALLNRQDAFIVNQASRIIAKLATWCPEGQRIGHQDLVYFLAFLKDQLRAPGNEYIQTAARCLQVLTSIPVTSSEL